ncbi:uncharacterized protein LDX57_006216 [Aspergillus melleus]|uniref:uncharacterized protein n=1 Tax=Aspergillus melleus TaxID=138277 RepID=UPI001E8CF2C0|nr:uncharacterized protein LDX57_006216 [Aspergillus melleus]KAH8428520.1 hypothetical protein LDX57_006216 [Aspergillus melleus]
MYYLTLLENNYQRSRRKRGTYQGDDTHNSDAPNADEQPGRKARRSDQVEVVAEDVHVMFYRGNSSRAVGVLRVSSFIGEGARLVEEGKVPTSATSLDRCHAIIKVQCGFDEQSEVLTAVIPTKKTKDRLEIREQRQFVVALQDGRQDGDCPHVIMDKDSVNIQRGPTRPVKLSMSPSPPNAGPSRTRSDRQPDPDPPTSMNAQSRKARSSRSSGLPGE